MTVLESLGGPHERLSEFCASDCPETDFRHPLCVFLDVAGAAPALPACSGVEDGFFAHDGQITKRPVRALTLSALAPKRHETLWDIGGGSGSIAIEWLLADPTTAAICIEARDDRVRRIAANAADLGVDRLRIVTGRAPEALADLPLPDAVFIGGGLSDDLMQALKIRLLPGTRLVANAVTLESEVLLGSWQARLGGSLLRIELAEAEPLGSRRAWRPAYPVVQWSVTL